MLKSEKGIQLHNEESNGKKAKHMGQLNFHKQCIYEILKL